MSGLLTRYNPTLLLYPQDPKRDRPGGFRPRNGWGDYHPCSAEFFVDRVIRRDRPESYDFVAGILARFRDESDSPPIADGLSAVRAFIGSARPETSAGWELDVCLPSQHPTKAWEAYRDFLAPANGPPEPAAGPAPYRCVTYAREVPTPTGKVLQYWYLYIYNDFLNHHEGDWEMVTIALDQADRPVEVAYSNHHGGVRRAWEDAPKLGDSPLVYVARGSHAGYFRFASGGHALIGDLSTGKVPPIFFFVKYLRAAANVVIRWVQRVPGIRLFRDNPPADPALDTTAPIEKVGVRVHPEVIELPEGDVTGDDDLWWMRFRGFWGSTRPRLIGSVGVIGPWASTSSYDLRWRDPLGWMATCKLDKHSGIAEMMGHVAEQAGEIIQAGREKVGR